MLDYPIEINPVSAHAILHLEDNPDDAFLLRTAAELARLPVAFFRVQDVEQAIAWLRGEGPFSNREEYPFPVAVLLDARLAQGSGLDVLAWVRRQKQMKNLPIFILTGSERPGEKQRAQSLGATGYVQKQPLYGDLLELLRHNLPPEIHIPQ